MELGFSLHFQMDEALGCPKHLALVNISFPPSCFNSEQFPLSALHPGVRLEKGKRPPRPPSPCARGHRTSCWGHTAGHWDTQLDTGLHSWTSELHSRNCSRLSSSGTCFSVDPSLLGRGLGWIIPEVSSYQIHPVIVVCFPQVGQIQRHPLARQEGS